MGTLYTPSIEWREGWARVVEEEGQRAIAEFERQTPAEPQQPSPLPPNPYEPPPLGLPDFAQPAYEPPPNPYAAAPASAPAPPSPAPMPVSTPEQLWSLPDQSAAVYSPPPPTLSPPAPSPFVEAGNQRFGGQAMPGPQALPPVFGGAQGWGPDPGPEPNHFARSWDFARQAPIGPGMTIGSAFDNLTRTGEAAGGLMTGVMDAGRALRKPFQTAVGIDTSAFPDVPLTNPLEPMSKAISGEQPVNWDDLGKRALPPFLQDNPYLAAGAGLALGAVLDPLNAPGKGTKGAQAAAAGAERLADNLPGLVQPSMMVADDIAKRLPNFIKWDLDSETKTLLTRMAEDPDVGRLIDGLRQGVITHESLINELAPRLGMTTKDFLKVQKGQALNQTELIVLHAAIESKATEAAHQAPILLEKLTQGKLGHEDKAELVKQLTDLGQLLAIGQGTRATAGRALNQFKIIVTHEMASAITGGNEKVAAQRALAKAEAERKRAQAIKDALEATDPAERSSAIRRAVDEFRKGDKEHDAAVRGYEKGQEAADKALARAGDAEYTAAERAARRAESAEGRAAETAAQRYQRMIDEAYADENALGPTAKKPDPYRAQVRDEMARMDGADADAWASHFKRLDDEAQRALKEFQRAEATAGRVAERQATQARKALEKLGEGGKITDAVLENYLRLQAGDDPLAVAHFIKSLTRVSNWERSSLYRLASMLSATSTHLTNVVGNAGLAAIDVALTPVAAGFDATRVAMSGGERTRYVSETGPKVRGMVEGAIAGFQDALITLQYGISPRDAAKIDQVRGGFATEQLRLRPGAVPGANWIPGVNKIDIPIGEMTERVRTPEFQAFGRTVPSVNLAQATNTTVEMPLRMLAAEDNVFRGAATQGAIRAIAHRKATSEGLRGSARAAREQEIIEHVTDYPLLLEQADHAAARLVLQEDREEVRKISALIRMENPIGMLLSVNIPFVKTPYNIAAQGAGMTPFGYLAARKSFLAGRSAEEAAKAALAVGGPELARVRALQTDAAGQRWAQAQKALAKDPAAITVEARANKAAERAALASSEDFATAQGHYGELADRMARATFGTAVMGGATALATAGFMTGPMPESESERNTLPPGYQPWSFKIPLPNGETKYVSFQNWGSVSIPLAATAMLVEIARRDKAGANLETLGRVVAGVGQYMTDQTFLQGLNNIISAAKSPMQYGDRLVEGMATQAVPDGALQRQVQRAMGMAARDPHGALEAILATSPLTANRVAPRLDALGQEIPQEPSGIAAFVSPARVTTERDEPVLAEMRRLDVGMGSLGKAITDDGAKYKLTNEQMQAYQKDAGQTVKEGIGTLIAQPWYQQAGDQDKAKLLEKVLDKSRDMARESILEGVKSAGAPKMTTEQLKGRAREYVQALGERREYLALRDQYGVSAAERKAASAYRQQLAAKAASLGGSEFRRLAELSVQKQNPEGYKAHVKQQISTQQYSRLMKMQTDAFKAKHPLYLKYFEGLEDDED